MTSGGSFSALEIVILVLGLVSSLFVWCRVAKRLRRLHWVFISRHVCGLFGAFWTLLISFFILLAVSFDRPIKNASGFFESLGMFAFLFLPFFLWHALWKIFSPFIDPKTDAREDRISPSEDSADEKPARLEICFTGFAAARRERLEHRATEAGMRVVPNATKNGLYVVGPYVGAGKLEEARDKGALILAESQLKRFLETGELPRGKMEVSSKNGKGYSA